MAKSRGWPLAVATLLLGAAIVVFAMRALGGSGSGASRPGAARRGAGGRQRGELLAPARRLRGGTPAARGAKTRLRRTTTCPSATRPRSLRAAGEDARAGYPIALALDTLGSALIVVALTRPRAREFFDPPTAKR